MGTNDDKDVGLRSVDIASALLSLRNACAHGEELKSRFSLNAIFEKEYPLPLEVRERLLAIQPDKLLSGVSHVSSSALEKIVQVIEGSSFDRVLDPWAGSGVLLSTIVEAGAARCGVGVVAREAELVLAKAVSADLPITWVQSLPLDWLSSSEEQFDMVVGNFPIGMQKERLTASDESGQEIAVHDDRGKLALLAAARKLTPFGLGLFIVPSMNMRGDETSVYKSLHRFDLHMSAFFALPDSPFSETAMPGGIAVIRRGQSVEIFVGKFVGDQQRDAILLDNYRHRRNSNEFGLGRLIPATDFVGWAFVEAQEKVRVRALRVGYPPVSVSELATAIELSKDSKFPDAVNAVYIPTIGKTKAVSSQAELILKAQNYLQLVLDPGKATAAFVAEFLSSPLGVAVREEVQSGFIPKITKGSISAMKLFLPPIAQQTEILETQGNIRNLKNDLQLLESRLWLEPRKCHDVKLTMSRYLREESFTEWLDRLPFPLASVLWTYHTAGNDQKRRYEHLLHFFEAMAQFLATIVLSVIESDKPIFESEKNRVAQALKAQKLTFKLGTFGTWKCVYELLAKSFRSMYNKPESSANVERLFCCNDDAVISMLTSSELVGVMQRCNAYRNSWLGHTGVVGEKEARARHALLEEELSKTRAAFGTAWDRYNLVLPGTSVFSSGAYRYTLQRVSGRCTPFEQFDASLVHPLKMATSTS